MRFVQLIEYNRKIFFFKNHARNWAGRLVSDVFLFFEKALYEIKVRGQLLHFIIFRQSSTEHTIKPNYIELSTNDPQICSILIFQKRVWEQFFNIFCLIFQEKCFLCYILLTDLISLSGCLCFLRQWAICVLQLFVSQVVTSKILKLTISSNQAVFLYQQKNQDTNLNILRMKRAFKMK